jgi:hypothetical protein
VVLLYRAVRSALTIAEIQDATGLSNDSASAAVRGLETKGLLLRQNGQHGKAVYFPVSETFERLLPVEGLFLSGQNPVFPDSASTTTTTISKVNLNQWGVVVEAGQNPVKPDSGRCDAYETRKMREAQEAEKHRLRAEIFEGQGVPYLQNLEACRLYGIGEPMASRLSEMRHVTPKLIAGHIRSLQQGETIGLAIVRIRSDELPRLWLDELMQETDNAPSLNEFVQKKLDLQYEFTEPGDDDEAGDDDECEDE